MGELEALSAALERPLNRRELEVLLALDEVGREWGRDAVITTRALSEFAGPAAGSLAALVRFGLVVREQRDGQGAYRLSDYGIVRADRDAPRGVRIGRPVPPVRPEGGENAPR